MPSREVNINPKSGEPRLRGMDVTARPELKGELQRPKEKPLIDRLKKSGLDPQKLLDLALPKNRKLAATKSRHRIMILGYIFLAFLPAAAFAGYMFFWASDQYHSTVAFAVRSSNSTSGTDILGMMLDSGGESTTSNSYILNDYLQSQTIVEELDKTIDFDAVYNNEHADWLFGMGSELSIEGKLAYWKEMVNVTFDATSGVIYSEVRSFNPADSVVIAEAILERSEQLVNKLSRANRRQSLRYAEETVARAEARLKAIRLQMLAYRDETQEVSPQDNARLAMELIAQMDQVVVEKKTEMNALLTYLDDNSPRIRLLKREISALSSQIEAERQRLGIGKSDQDAPVSTRDRLSLRIADFTELKLEEEFAQQFYTTALAGLEKARQDADKNTMYLATFIEPTLSEEAQYPHRFLYSLGFFLAISGLWAVGVLLYYNIRDRT